MVFMASATGAGAHPKPPDNALANLEPPVLRADPEVAEACNRRVGVGRREQAGVLSRQHPDRGAGPQRTVSPPVTMRSCSSGTPSRRRMRALSGEATTVAPVARAMGATP